MYNIPYYEELNLSELLYIYAVRSSEMLSKSMDFLFALLESIVSVSLRNGNFLKRKSMISMEEF